MEYKINSTKRCLECGDPIQYGRSDKKFCCEACKNRWHNLRAREFLKVHSKTIHALDKNYKILNDFISRGLTSVEIGDAIQWGFNPDVMTSMRKTRLRTEIRCYDIKYYRSDTRIYNIERVKLSEK